MKLQSVELTHVGSVRSENQDSIFSLVDRGVFMVADGMGGEKAGAEASAQVIETVKRVANGFFKSQDPRAPSVIEAMLRDALQQANSDVFQISVKEPDKTGLGSTGSLLTLHKGIYFIAQVGDSRIYLMREGNIRLMTRDHTVVWALYENGVITRDQLETHPERHLLTQCVGGPKPLNVDTYEGRLQEGDVFLICSDGLTGYAGEEAIFKIYPEATTDLKGCAEHMIEAALGGGGGDNVSVILIRVEKLDPEDNWMPEVTPTPRKLPMPSEDEITNSRLRPPALKKRPIGLITGAVALICVLVAVLFVVARPKSFKVPMEIVPPPNMGESKIVDLNHVDIQVIDSKGVEIPEPVGDRKGNVYYLQLPDNGNYIIRVGAPGLIGQEIKRYLSSKDVDPFKVETRLAGRLVIVVNDKSQIGGIVLRHDSPGGEGAKADYEYKAADAKKPPKLVHDLEPDVNYRLVVTDKSGTPYERFAILDAGSERKLTIPIQQKAGATQ